MEEEIINPFLTTPFSSDVSDKDKKAYIRKHEYAIVSMVSISLSLGGFIFALLGMIFTISSLKSNQANLLFLFLDSFGSLGVGLGIAGAVLGHKGKYDNLGVSGFAIGLFAVLLGVIALILYTILCFNISGILSK